MLEVASHRIEYIVQPSQVMELQKQFGKDHADEGRGDGPPSGEGENAGHLLHRMHTHISCRHWRLIFFIYLPACIGIMVGSVGRLAGSFYMPQCIIKGGGHNCLNSFLFFVMEDFPLARPPAWRVSRRTIIAGRHPKQAAGRNSYRSRSYRLSAVAAQRRGMQQTQQKRVLFSVSYYA